MSDSVKFKVQLTPWEDGWYESTVDVEVPREEWDRLDVGERQLFVAECIRDAVKDDIDCQAVFEDKADDPEVSS